MQAAVDQRLITRLRDSDALQDVVQVVRSNTVSGTLTEERSQDDQQQAFAVAAGLQENTPAILFVQLFQLDCFSDLCEFGSDKVILSIAVGMELYDIRQLRC